MEAQGRVSTRDEVMALTPTMQVRRPPLFRGFGGRGRLGALFLILLVLSACAHDPGLPPARDATADRGPDVSVPPSAVEVTASTVGGDVASEAEDTAADEVDLDEYVSKGQSLVLAARFGQIERLRDQGATIDARDELGYTALIAAAGEPRLDVLELIIGQGADVDARTDDGTTALMMAAAKGYPENVDRLLAAGAEVDARNDDGYDALMMAIRFGHAAIVDTLLAHGADANPYGQEEILERDLVTPLMLAARHGSSLTAGIRIVRSLLEHGAEPNLVRPNGDTAMTIARRHGRALIVAELRRHGARDESPYALLSRGEALLKAIELGDSDKAIELIDAATDPNYRNHLTGVTPLLSAAFHGRLAIVESLVDHGAEINDVPMGLSEMRIGSSDVPVAARPLARAASRGDTPLIAALRRGHSRVAAYLIERGALPILPNRISETPGELAAKYGDTGVMRSLLAAGLDPDLVRLPAIDGFSIANIVRRARIRPIIVVAAAHGHPDVVEILLQHGADPDLRDRDGRTALSWAASEGRLACVRKLLDYDADPNIGDEDNVTPLMLAARSGYPRIVEALVSHGADVNAVDGVSDEERFRPVEQRRGNTALILAARGGHEAIVRYLLSHGALTGLQTASGERALDVARRFGHQAVVKLLE